MARRKMVLAIVEGTTDEESLLYGLTAVFSQFDLAVQVTHGDVTAEIGSSAATIRRKVGSLVKAWIDANHLASKADIIRILHVVDTDGAFVPNETVVEEVGRETLCYETEAIRTSKKVLIEERNRRKSHCLIELVKTKKVLGNIPYQVFFMSSNLEHAIHDRLNCSPAEKAQLAAAFSMRFFDDVEGFKAFFEAPALLLGNSYQDSWKAIQLKNESLHRHANLAFSWKEAEMPVAAMENRVVAV